MPRRPHNKITERLTLTAQDRELLAQPLTLRLGAIARANIARMKQGLPLQLPYTPPIILRHPDVQESEPRVQ